jgi:hypothetical protein
MQLTNNIGHTESVDSGVLHQVLVPYKRTHTDYLKYACVSESPSTDTELFSVTGSYEIPCSCYIDATGHFNAVEFIICYNQLAYFAFGHLTSSGQLSQLPVKPSNAVVRGIMEDLTFDAFLDQQLASMFIVKSELGFKAPIDPRRFYAAFGIDKVIYRSGTFFIKTHCTFFDDAVGQASGEVVLAYTTHLKHERKH